jgi:hypothetical protein
MLPPEAWQRRVSVCSPWRFSWFIRCDPAAMPTGPRDGAFCGGRESEERAGVRTVRGAGRGVRVDGISVWTVRVGPHRGRRDAAIPVAPGSRTGSRRRGWSVPMCRRRSASLCVVENRSSEAPPGDRSSARKKWVCGAPAPATKVAKSAQQSAKESKERALGATRVGGQEPSVNRVELGRIICGRQEVR